jgi:formylglycine-generating enzyme required for sulfatase activity
VAYRANSQAVTLLSLSPATKEHPFVNSLGMKFVPVPGTDVLFSVWETRSEDYQAFCDARGKTWDKPRFPQSADHPAVNVSWNDATEFCEWLSGKEGKKYRLPTDHEWSCAVGIGDQEDAAASPKSKESKIANVFPWGKQWPPPNDAGNYLGEECKTPAGLAALRAAGYDASNWVFIGGFNDGNVFTAEVGSFRPNGLGIYDLGGDVWEWCQDKYEPNSPLRVLRGGSWELYDRDYLLSSCRNLIDPDGRFGGLGFRVVVEAGSGRSSGTNGVGD